MKSPWEEHPQLYAEEGALDNDTIEELGKRLQKFRTDTRRSTQHLRHRILHSKHREDIAGRVYEQVPSLKDQIKPHISVALNPAADIVSNVAAVYGQMPMRTLEPDVLTDVQADAFAALVREAGLEIVGRHLAKVAYFVGPVAVVPRVRGGRLRLDALMPHTYEVVLSPSDPLGQPVAIAFEIGGNGKADWCVVDSVSFRYFKLHASGRIEELSGLAEPHGLDRLPASILRFTPCMDPDDWWDAECHQRLVDGALDVGRIYATMGFIRRTQNKILLAMIGNTDLVAKGQNLADDKPITAQTSGDSPGTDIQFQALPYDTNPSNFFAEIKFTVESMAESTGVPVSVKSSGVTHLTANYDLDFDQDKLTELRDDLVWHAERFERDLWQLAVSVVARSKHEMAGKVPPGPLLLEALRIEFGRLTRRFADPEQERKDWDWKIGKGIKTFPDAYRRFVDPFADDESAMEAIERNMERNGVVWTIAAKHNAGMSPDAAPGSPESAQIVGRAQANGALGPMVRDAGKPPGGGDLDDSKK